MNIQSERSIFDMEILKVENLTKVYGKDSTKVTALDALLVCSDKRYRTWEKEITK